MKTIFSLKWFFYVAIAIFIASCEKETDEKKIADSADTYDLKEYKAMRSPSVNKEGYGMDFVHDSIMVDTFYMDGVTPFEYDLLFYNQMVYYKNASGEVQSEGCPVIFLYKDTLDVSNSVKACQVGEGIDYFNSFTYVSPFQEAELSADPDIDLEACTDSTGKPQKGLVMEAYTMLIIGNKFRTSVLEIPEDKTEEEVQPVFLVKTREGLFAKFMVTAYQGIGADKQKTTIMWQVFKN